MKENAPPKRVGWNFYGTLLAAVVLTSLLHEAAHWLAGVALGYEMVMSLNAAAPRSGGFLSERDAFLVSGAGPLLTFAQGVVAFVVVRKRASLLAYPFLFAAWFMRFAAAFVSLMHPNDEARMSLALGWGFWTLPALVVIALLALTFVASRRLRLGWQTNVASYLLCSAAFAAIVSLDAR